VLECSLISRQVMGSNPTRRTGRASELVATVQTLRRQVDKGACSFAVLGPVRRGFSAEEASEWAVGPMRRELATRRSPTARVATVLVRRHLDGRDRRIPL